MRVHRPDFGSIYRQIWRYGGIQRYIRLLIVDAIAFAAALAIELTLSQFVPIEKVTFSRLLSIASMNLPGALAIRMIYRYCFKCGTADTPFGKFLRLLLRIFAGEELIHPNREAEQRIKIAILGAGRVGVILADTTMPEDVRKEVRAICGSLNVEVQDFAGYFQESRGAVTLRNLMECAKGEVELVINGKSQHFANGEQAVMSVTGKYVVTSVSGRENRLVVVLQKDILVPNDVKEEWVQTYEKETGEDISSF